MRQVIRALPEETVNRIAAGEVVESPASVLKELLENALDAGASRVELEIAAGGIGLIKLADDGQGIPQGELDAALERHATSKIRELTDLEDAATLGFRGEALAAIASVSLLEICSRVEEDASAWSILSRGGERREIRPAARACGTTVTVRELFGAVPARRKFLGSEAAEKRRLLALWHSYVLAWPELDFTLREGGRELSHYAATRELRERARQILGDSTARHMVEVEYESEGYRVSGLAALPLISRGNRSHQFLYLGRRPISDAGASHAVGQAYSEILAPGRFPATLLFLETPPGMVDVNVHPAKREVRFRDKRRIHHVISRGLRQAIGGGDLGERLARGEDLLLGPQRMPDGFVETEQGPEKQAGPREEIFGRPVLERQPGERESELGILAASGTPEKGGRGHESGSFAGAGAQGYKPRRQQLSPAESDAYLRLGAGVAGEGMEQSPDEEAGPLGAERPEERRFWQLHNTFILTQIRGGLVIIDQHNAHERVLFDAARAAMEGEDPGSQRLLFPHTVEMDPDEMAAYREQAELFASFGFIIEEFGDRTLSVHGIPDNLRRWDGGRVIRDILDDVMAETGAVSRKRDRALMSYACRSAIKAGEPLREEEMQQLVDQLFGTANPYTCPHGRPIVIRISMDELEKRFHRQVPEKAARAGRPGVE